MRANHHPYALINLKPYKITTHQRAFYNSIINNDFPTFMRLLNPKWWQVLWHWHFAIDPKHEIVTGENFQIGNVMGEFSPLFLSVYYNRPQMTEALVQQGAYGWRVAVTFLENPDQPVECRQSYRGSVIKYAIARGHDQCAYHLGEARGANPRISSSELPYYYHYGVEPPPFVVALNYSNYELAADLFYQEYRINRRSTIDDTFRLIPRETPGCIPIPAHYFFCDEEFSNPLHWAAKNLGNSAVDWLLKRGANPNYYLDYHYSKPVNVDLLKIACQENDAEMGYLLYTHRARSAANLKQDCANYLIWNIGIAGIQAREDLATTYNAISEIIMPKDVTAITHSCSAKTIQQDVTSNAHRRSVSWFSSIKEGALSVVGLFYDNSKSDVPVKTLPHDATSSEKPEFKRDSVNSTFIQESQSRENILITLQWCMHHLNHLLPWNKLQELTPQLKKCLEEQRDTVSSLETQFATAKKSRSYRFGVHRNLFEDTEYLLNKTKSNIDQALSSGKICKSTASNIDNNISRIEAQLPVLIDNKKAHAARQALRKTLQKSKNKKISIDHPSTLFGKKDNEILFGEQYLLPACNGTLRQEQNAIGLLGT